MKTLDIGIVGAGFAGLTSAALLARQGHRVTVYDRFDEPRATGAGILIQPSGLAAMRAIGIAQQVLERGARVTHLWGVNQRGRPVVNLHYDGWRPGSFGIGLHRGVLFEALWRAAHEAGAEVRTGAAVDDLAALQQSHGLAVVANGAASSLRRQTGLPCRDRVYPWGAVWAILEDPSQSYGETLWQWYRGAREMMGIMPTGRAPATAQGEGMPVVSLFWSLDAAQHTAWQSAGLAAFRSRLLALNPQCEALLSQIRHLDQLTWARYWDVWMARYHTDRCVVIGDAAHATSPQLGQGTNLALLDALTLSRCIAQRDSLGGVAGALAHYSRLRTPHLHFYGQASRWLTPLFQSDQKLLPWLRDVFMAHASRWPVAGHANRETLVGVRRNWWGWRSMDVDALERD